MRNRFARLAPVAALAIASGAVCLAIASAVYALFILAGTDNRATPAPAPSVTYALNAFDVAGDGYPVTIQTGLSLAECERMQSISNDHGTPAPYTYVYVCRAV